MARTNAAQAPSNILALTAGLGLGAGLMYFWDPARGRRRRRKLVDQASSLAHHDANTLRKKGEDLLNRARGLAVEAAAEVSEAVTVDDDILVARIRSQMGHILDKSHNVEVLAHNGAITLKGKLGTAERRALKDHIRAMPGINAVHDQLDRGSIFSPGLIVGLVAGIAALIKKSAEARASATDQGC